MTQAEETLCKHTQAKLMGNSKLHATASWESFFNPRKKKNHLLICKKNRAFSHFFLCKTNQWEDEKGSFVKWRWLFNIPKPIIQYSKEKANWALTLKTQIMIYFGHILFLFGIFHCLLLLKMCFHGSAFLAWKINHISHKNFKQFDLMVPISRT